MQVPFLDLKRRQAELGPGFKDAIDKIIESCAFINGPEVKLFEAELSSYIGAPVISCASGTDALLLAMMDIDLTPHDEVIVPSFTFIATAEVPVFLGAKIRFADIDPLTFNVDVSSVEKLINHNTKVVVAVDLFGHSADYKALRELCDKHDLVLVQDAAQSLGGRYNNLPLGSLANYGCLSFFPAKNLGCLGDGGAVVLRDVDTAEQIRIFRQHGGGKKYQHTHIGVNSRLDTLQAAVLLEQLPYLDEWIQRRRQHAHHYNEAFNSQQFTDKLIIPVEQQGTYHSYNQYVVRVLDGCRDDLKIFLFDHGIQSMIYYPKALHQQPVFQSISQEACSESKKACSEVLALPISPWLTAEEQDFVIQKVKYFFK